MSQSKKGERRYLKTCLSLLVTSSLVLLTTLRSGPSFIFCVILFAVAGPVFVVSSVSVAPANDVVSSFYRRPFSSVFYVLAFFL